LGSGEGEGTVGYRKASSMGYILTLFSHSKKTKKNTEKKVKEKSKVTRKGEKVKY